MQSTGPDFAQNVDFVVQLLFSISLFKFQKVTQSIFVRLNITHETSLDYLFIGKSEEQLPQKTVGRLSVNSQPTVGQQLSNSRPTVFSANSRPTVG